MRPATWSVSTILSCPTTASRSRQPSRRRSRPHSSPDAWGLGRRPVPRAVSAKEEFSPAAPPGADIGYAALATGDINHDGFPDIVAASHFGKVQTFLSDGRGGFTEQILQREDGYVAAQLADVNGDGHLDLILLGYRTAGIEVYLGDGRGNWRLHTTLPQPRPGRTMPGRDLVVGDLNHDGHVDLVAAFQRWGVYIYYGDGRGGFIGGPVDFHSADREFQSLALADVDKDGHPHIVINATSS